MKQPTTILAILAASGLGAQAAVVSVNFAAANASNVYNVTTAAGVGVVNDTTWENVNNKTTTSATDVDGSTIDVAWDDQHTWSMFGDATSNGARELYKGRFDTPGDLTITVSDINSTFTNYDVIVYYGLSSSHVFDLSVNGGTATHVVPAGEGATTIDGYLTAGPADGTNTGSLWARFNGLSGDTLTILAERTGNKHIGITGIQLVPEPSALALLGLSGLGLFIRRRK